MRVNRFIGCAIGTCCAIGPAFADDFTWGNSNNDIAWDSVSGNWSLGGLPTFLIPDADDSVFFDTDLLGSGVLPQADLNGNREVLIANFLGEAGFTLTGNAGDTLSLGTGDLIATLGPDINPHTIAADVRLLDAGTWDIGAAAFGGVTLNVTGAINSANSTANLTKTGDGTLQVVDVNIESTITVDGGTLQLGAGGQMNSALGVIGDTAGSTGTIRVAGAGANWDNDLDVTVGNDGAGVLSIEDGGTVTVNNNTRIGQEAGSTGELTVTGAGSAWNHDSSLVVGNSGEGTLSVEDGATATSGSAFLGLNVGSSGNATVSGAGSTWSVSSALSMGGSGEGSLRIEDGGAVSTIGGSMGLAAGSHGEATITGAGSTWTNISTLSIGGPGGPFSGSSGTLLIEDGGAVSNTAATLGGGEDSVGAATVTGAGSSWTNGDLTIGGSGDGLLLIDDGGAVSGSVVIIGDESGSISSTTVTGTDSTLTSSFNVAVGNSGTGTLLVENGGTVDSLTGIDTIGRFAGSMGEATVAGAGSSWSNLDSLVVGDEGTGTLRVEDGGTMSNSGGFIGLESGSAGVVTVTGAESTWTNSSQLTVGGAGDGTLLIEDGGVVSNTSGIIGDGTDSTGSVTVTGADSEWINGSSLSIGDLGAGTLSIENGAFVSSTNASMAGSPNSTGEVTVTGDGSTWLVPEFIDMGILGSGALRIEDGGTVASGGTMVGLVSFATGDVTVAGMGSAWTIDGDLRLAFAGEGTLLIQDGAAVSNDAGIIGESSSSTGSATVTGVGSSWTNRGDLSIGGDSGSAGGIGALTVSDNALTAVGGTLTIWDNGSVTQDTGSTLLVDDTTTTATPTEGTIIGDTGTGTLLVTGGGQLASSDGYLGFQSGSTGNATVTGSGSTWTNSGDVYVGGSDTTAGGTASLTLSDNAAMTVGGSLTIWDDGTVNQNSNTTLLVDGAVTTASDDDATFIGDAGNGTLLVTGGGQLTSTDAIVGNQGNATGNATVTGAGSAWTISDDLTVGEEGDGTLRIEGGATVSNDSATLGSDNGSTGLVTVTGSGSAWDNAGLLLVGRGGQGTLRVEDGAAISSAGGTLGPFAQSSGNVTVTGSGSTWINSGELLMAETLNGNGRLTIQDGGQVFNTNASLGFENFLSSNISSTSRVSVTGTDSAWINSGNVYVGGNRFGAGGDATVTISNNALTAVGGTLTIYEDGAVTQNTSTTLLIDNTVATPTITEGTVIGDTGNGSLSIQGGGQLSSTDAFLGLLSGSTGSATVTGAGSTWTNSGDVYVGGSDTAAGGTANLTLSDNATMTVGGSLTAWDAGTVNQNNTATLLIDDATTNASKTNATTIGNTGAGSLQITGGGQVSGTDAFLGLNAGSTGDATVTGEDSSWTNSGDVYVGGSNTAAGGAASLTLSDNATMSVGGSLTIWNAGTVAQNETATLLVDDTVSTATATETTTVGDTGNGALLITGGGGMTSIASALGLNAGSSGEATITGTDSSWNSETVLVAGAEGTGTLRVEDGGEVTSPGFTVIGSEAGSVGQATVTGTNSTLNTGLVFFVGDAGNGTLLIDDQGAVVSTNEAAIGNQAGGVGVGTVRGADSSWAIDDELEVGDAGTGTLLIEDGGGVASVEGNIGDRSTGVGGVTVTGAGSTLNITDTVHIGREGEGTLSIEDGGAISSAITTIGDTAGSQGEATITGVGSSWNIDDSLTIGSDGDGSLLIQDGGTVTSVGAIIIGDQTDGTGSVTVTGGDSTWNNSNTILQVGNAGAGTMLIEDGAVVTSNSGFMALDGGSTSDVTVTGAGSTWAMDESLFVGFSLSGSASATLLVEDGGTVTTLDLSQIGVGAGTTAEMTVTGAGSSWINTDELTVAFLGNGTLLIEDGGVVSNAEAKIASNTGSVGVVTVTGDDSRWDSSGVLIIGQNGDATLNLNSGTVSAAGLSFGAGTATLNLAGGRLELIGDQTLGSDVLSILSPALTSPDHTLAITGALTLEDTFTIDGANVEVGQLNIDQLGSFDGQSGSLLAEVLQLSEDASLDLSNPGLIGTNDFELTIGTLEVAGTVRGSGTFDLATGVDVTATGEVRVAAGERAYFAGSGLSHTNSGRLEIIGDPTTAGNVAELEFDGQLTNATGGQIAGLGMTARFNGGLVNEGTVTVSFGTSNLFGDVDNTGRIGLAGNAQLTFFDNLVQNGTLDIRSGSTAVVFGDFSGAGGTDGTGTLEVLGTFSPGNSPDVVSFGGDLDLSSSLTTLIELGGLALGEFDRSEVAGLLTLGGDLTVELYDGHTLALNQTYEVFTAGLLSGTFGNFNDGDLVADFNGIDLFIDYDFDAGSVTLFTVPEPSIVAMLGLGLLLIGNRRRSNQSQHTSKHKSRSSTPF
ncbi:MAG: PEP-CTERM sorting domain-containing protein [Planctomycetota bacterium]